jgi:hypothetical protein
MKKSDLLKFLELYNLNGTIERVKLEADGKNIKTSIVAEDKTLAGNITFNGIALEKGEYGIHDTAQFKKMLSILDEEVEMSVNKVDDRAVSLTVADKNTESLIILANMSVIPKTPTVSNLGVFDLEIELDDAFIDRFIKAKNALPEVNTFTLGLNKKGDKVELIVGDSDNNTNRIKLEVKTVTGKDKPAKEISFNANYFKEILSRNRDVTGVIYKINTAGISHLNFKTSEYEANYYLLKTTKS